MRLTLKGIMYLFNVSQRTAYNLIKRNEWTISTSLIYGIETRLFNVPDSDFIGEVEKINSIPIREYKFLADLDKDRKTLTYFVDLFQKVLQSSANDNLSFNKFCKSLQKEKPVSESFARIYETLQKLTFCKLQDLEHNVSKEDKTVESFDKTDHCKPFAKMQSIENKVNTKSLQCTVNSTVKLAKLENNALTSYKIEEIEKSIEWIDIKSTVNLLHVTRQTVFKKIKTNEYTAIKVPKENGGLKTFIDIKSFSVEIQQKWKLQQMKESESKEIQVASSEFSKFPEDSKRRALARETIVKTYLERRKQAIKQGIGAKAADTYFQKDLDNKEILENELKILGKIDALDLSKRSQHRISIRTIKEWHKKWKESGEDLTVLCDNYSECGRSLVIKPEIAEEIAILYSHPNGFTYRQMYAKLLMKHGDSLPSFPTVYRFISTITKPSSERLKASFSGKKSLRKISSYVPRMNDAFPGDIWISDGYELKFLVYSPYHKSPDRSKRLILRPVIVYWLDQATEMITGYAVSHSERFDVVISSLRDGVEKFGVPKGIMTDNAGSYVNIQSHPERYANSKKDTPNKRKAVELLESGYFGFYKDVGVERIIHTTPGNPQAKKIEPYNHKIFDIFEKSQFTYLGKSPETRPERMDITNHNLIRKYGDKILSWENFLLILENHIDEWNNVKHKHLNNLSAKEYYLRYIEENPPKKLSLQEIEFKMTARTTVKLSGSQIELMGNIYQHPAFETYIGQKIQVIYDVRNLDFVHIATLNGSVLHGKAHRAIYGSQTNQEQTVDAISARAYYEKRKKAVYIEYIQNGGLSSKKTSKKVNQAVIGANEKLELEDSLRIDQKMKDAHKDNLEQNAYSISKRDKPVLIKPKEESFVERMQKESLNQIIKEHEDANNEQVHRELTSEELAEKKADEIMDEILKVKGIPRKVRK
jgi:hypothetical protein